MSPPQDTPEEPPSAPSIDIAIVTAGPQVDWVRELFVEYQQSLNLDLAFQGFTHELLALPGEYQNPYGILLLALVDAQPAGCCAFRPLLDSDHSNACEMKRLYVRRAFRGFGLGRMLVEQTLMHARQSGYDRMLLDTLTDMEAARALYAEMGFTEVPPYYHNPVPGAHYLKVEL